MGKLKVFYNCKNLKAVVVPPSVVTMGIYVFLDAPNVTVYCQPDSIAPHRFIGRPPVRRDRRSDQVPRRLSGVGVFVIVVGNYFVAAFYEASGASTCNSGFHVPVETSAPPNAMYI